MNSTVSSMIPWASSPLPSNWDVRRNMGLFDQVVNRGDEGDLLAVTIEHGVLRQSELAALTDRKLTASEDRGNYKIVEPGDLVYNKMRMWQGAIGMAPCRGIVSPAYIVLRAKRGVDSRFFLHQYRSVGFVAESRRWSYGICDDMNSLRYEDFKTMYSLVPPLEEQQAIASFLDRETSRIDSIIQLKQRQIELLEEKRVALITQAVTKGLDPNVKMKDSGVEWLGDIPEHWEVAPLYSRYRVDLGKMLDTKRIGQSNLHPYLRNADVQWGAINTKDLPMMSFAPTEWERYLLHPGDLLVCEGGELGESAVWQGAVSPCFYQKALHRLRPLDTGRDIAQFFYHVLYAGAHIGVFTAGASVSTIGHLTAEKLRIHRFPFPPVEEQHAIGQVLEKHGERIDRTLSLVGQSIELLHEYRSSLINAAVTGQIDVRGEVATS